MNPVAKQLSEVLSKREANARRVWKEAVVAVASGQELSRKQFDELSDARFTLNRSPERFDAEVKAWASFVAYTTRLEAVPPAEADAAEMKRIEARIKEIDEVELKKLQAEKGELQNAFRQLGQVRTSCNYQIEQLKRLHPELFDAG